MPADDVVKLRDYLHESAVIAGRLSEAVSAGRIPPQLAALVTATRNSVMATQQITYALETALAQCPEVLG